MVIALLDREGTIIAHWPNSNKYAGQKAAPSLMTHLKTAPATTTFETTTFDNVPVLTALSRVEPFGWTVAIGTPHEDYLGPLWQSLALIIAGAFVALAIGLGLARYVAHQITTPMEALVTYAGNTQGEAPPEVTGLSETDALATALRRYVETSEKAEREAAALNTTLEQRIAAAVAERDDAQARLLESQKMEAVGQLTGGIAHDFNNLLTAVIGSLDLIRKQAVDDQRLQTLAEIAIQGAQRGAQLVAQLLAFGRRQTLSPQSLSLDRALADIRLLIGPAAGSDVKLATRLAGDLWPCYADRSQLEIGGPEPGVQRQRRDAARRPAHHRRRQPRGRCGGGAAARHRAGRLCPHRRHRHRHRHDAGDADARLRAVLHDQGRGQG